MSSQPVGLSRAKSSISDYLSTSGYYTCISKDPLPLRWNLNEDSPAGISFSAGNVVRMRSFVYKAPYLWAEILSGGFVCAGVGDSRMDAADTLLEEYFEPYQMLQNPLVADERCEPSTQEVSVHVAPEKSGQEVAVQVEAALSEKVGVTAAPVEVGKIAAQVDALLEVLPASATEAGALRVPFSRSPSASSGEEADDDLENMVGKILDLFRIFDQDGDGTISIDELASVLQACDHEKWTDAKVRDLLSIMDANKDRRVSYEEFIHWICGTSRWRKQRKEFFRQMGVESNDLRDMSRAASKQRHNERRTIRGSIARGL